MTLSYSLWLILTLFLVFIILFFSFRARIYEVENQNLKDVIKLEKQAYLEGHSRLGQPSSARYGLYVTAIKDPDGHMELKETDRSSAEDELMDFFQKHDCCQTTPKIVKLQHQKEDQRYLYVSERVQKSRKDAVVLYVSKDLSAVHEEMENWFFMLVSIGIAAFILSILIGDRLAKRAMRPVIESIERQRKFSADASHELRTPLSIFSASIQVLEEEEKERLSSYGLSVLKDLKEESTLMGKLVKDLLTLTKYDHQKMKLDREYFSMNEAIRTIQREYQSILNEKQSIMFQEETSQDIEVYADKLKIKQLLYILLDNSLKFTNDKDVIELGFEKQSGFVVLKVVDKGVGIKEEDLPNIFDRFFQGDEARSADFGGAGLGLSIAKAIVEAHNGKIDAESKVGIGTTIRVWIPIVDKNR